MIGFAPSSRDTSEVIKAARPGFDTAALAVCMYMQARVAAVVLESTNH